MGDKNNIDEITKEYLKSMPVWEHVDRFGVEIAKFRHELDSYLKRLEKPVGSHEKPPASHEEPPASHEKAEGSDEKAEGSGGLRRREGEGEKAKEPASDEVNKDPIYDESLHLLRKKIRDEDEVYAMIEPDKPWVKCKLTRVFQRPRVYQSYPVHTIRLKLPPDYSQIKDVDKLSIAWTRHHGRGLKPAKRVIAGPDNSQLMPGIIGNQPNERSKYRYLVHFDNGSAGYYKPEQVYPIVWQSIKPWKDPKLLGTDHQAKNIHAIYNIMRLYPKKLYVQIGPGSSVDLERNGKSLPALVLQVDEDILKLRYKDGTEEQVYRGSSRLLRRQNIIAKQLANSSDIEHFNPTLLVFMRDYHTASRFSLDEDDNVESVARTLNTARKSTTIRYDSLRKIDVDLNISEPVPDIRNLTSLTSEEEEFSKSHRCNPDCLYIENVKTESSVTDFAEFRNVSDLKVPLLLGWKRRLCRLSSNTRGASQRVSIIYESPCKKIYRLPHTLRRHLSDVKSKLDIDFFTFDREVEINSSLPEFHAVHYQENIAVSQDGQCLENKLVSLMNQYDQERLPKDYIYFNVTVPHPVLAAKGFTLNQDFKSGCDCDGDCSQRVTCHCHILNEEASGLNGHLKGVLSKDCQYFNKRLLNQVTTGIFECNSMCKCSSKCGNRVVQNGIRFRLQIQKYPNEKGWGVITLDDIPKGAFICTYTAELLDDADQYGDSDMYYADLDYISINESRKGTESDDENDEGIDVDRGSKRKSPSDDEEIDEEYSQYMPRRYPARDAHRGSQQQTSARFKKLHDILRSHDFTLDARMKGNLGRFLNHSCDPNCTAQNVFFETHDLRFPTVAFFASKIIKATEEITWDYNYKMGAIVGRKIICLCRKPNCRGRIL